MKWLIRHDNNMSLVWQRKYIMGCCIPLPWGFHGGTNICFTQDRNKDVVIAALEYIRFKDKAPTITFEERKCGHIT